LRPLLPVVHKSRYLKQRFSSEIRGLLRDGTRGVRAMLVRNPLTMRRPAVQKLKKFVSHDQLIVYKQKQFERLLASKYDFQQAAFCANYLLKKGWHCMPWERRGSIYEQQTAFVTNLVVAYARPFTKSEGWPEFPMKLVTYDLQQLNLHKRLLELRHGIFAHSDSRNFQFTPFETQGFKTQIESVPFAVLSADDTERVRNMIGQLLKTTKERLDALRDELLEARSSM
jgi:hypothetical protein